MTEIAPIPPSGAAGAGPIAGLPALRPPPPRRRSPRRRRSFRVRLLPALIFVSVLMVGVRIGDLWEGLTGTGPAALRVPLAAEANAEEPTPTRIAEAPAEPRAMATTTAEPMPAIDRPMGAEMFDPEDLSAGEWDVLQQLSARRDALDRRERDLDQREALLAVAEQRVDEKVVELESVRSQIETLLGQVDEEGEAQLLGLVSIYESMRPADAATIFDGLDLEVLISVMERMRGQKSAAILAGMNPERARLVTTELARRRDLPDLPD